jgi:hypothetical protein
MHQKQSSQDIIGYMRMKNLQDAGKDNVFFLKKSCRKMYTIFSAVQRQRRISDVMTSFGLAAYSAVYYHAGSSLKVDKSCEYDVAENTWWLFIGINKHFL